MSDLNSLVILIMMFALGALIAGVYLSSLWLTVQRISRGRHPALWLVSSLVVRMGLLLTAFYFIVSDGHWERLLAALAGFVILRTFAIRRVRHQLSTNVQKG